MTRLLPTIISATAFLFIGTIWGAPDKEPYFTGEFSPSVQVEKTLSIDQLPIDAEKVTLFLDTANVPSLKFAEPMLQDRLEDLAETAAKPLEIYAGLADSPHFTDKKFDRSNVQDKKNGYTIRWELAPEVNRIYAIGNDNRGTFYAIMTLLQCINRPGNAILVREIDDYPEWETRYMTDYFLVQPESMPRFFGTWKITSYAVQCDASWRDLSAEAKPQWGAYKTMGEALAAYKNFYEESGGLFELMLAPRIYGFRDHVKFDASNEENITQLISDCRKAAQCHVSHIMIRADDVDPQINGKYQFSSEGERKKFHSVGEAHGYVMKRLYEALHEEFPNLGLSFCPGPYTINSHRATEDPAKTYLEDLAKMLPEDVAIVWTGADVVSPVIDKTAEDTYSRLIGNHKLYSWHNPSMIAGALACPDNLSLYDGYRQRCDSFAFVNSEGAGKPRNRPSDILYNDYLWNPTAYEGRTTYLKEVAMCCGVDRTAYGKMLVDLEAIATATEQEKKIQLIETVREASKAFADAMDQRYLGPYLDRQYANATADYPLLYLPSGPLMIDADGRLNEEVWQHATQAPLQKIDGSSPEGCDSIMYAYYNPDKELLYLAFSCAKREAIPKISSLPRDGEITANDSILLNILPCGERLLNLGFDAGGNRFDHYHWVLDWDPDWQLGIQERPEGGYTAELIIPIAAFREATYPKDKSPRSGEVWRIQVTRHHAEGNEKLFLATPNPLDAEDAASFAKLFFP